MKLRNIGQPKRWVRRATALFRSQVVILLYHRVFEALSDPQLLCVSPKHFDQHLEYLKQHYQVVNLHELVSSMREGKLPKRAVVVTLDDGYADNLYHAKPLLEHHDIPATVFLISGYIGQEREFWWDELDGLLLQAGTLPETLRLTVNGSVYQWELGRAAHYSKEDFEQHRHWSVLEKDDPSPRQHLYRALCELLCPLPKEERDKILDELLTWASSTSMSRPAHHSLSPDEVLHLVEGGLVEVGAHTVTHPLLARLRAATQRDEIQGSKTHLEEILGRSVNSFSYPYGSRSAYTAETVTIVREAGFTCACSNFADAVWQGSDSFQLPRVLVRDWDGEEFAHRLEAWLR
jgi:peptidoglycan/xylan/chitin deacetylase (PgdA/CDA1 family)